MDKIAIDRVEDEEEDDDYFSCLSEMPPYSSNELIFGTNLDTFYGPDSVDPSFHRVPPLPSPTEGQLMIKLDTEENDEKCDVSWAKCFLPGEKDLGNVFFEQRTHSDDLVDGVLLHFVRRSFEDTSSESEGQPSEHIHEDPLDLQSPPPHPSKNMSVKAQDDAILITYDHIPDPPEIGNDETLLVWKCERFFESLLHSEGESDGETYPHFDPKPLSADEHGCDDANKEAQDATEVAIDKTPEPAMSSDDNNNNPSPPSSVEVQADDRNEIDPPVPCVNSEDSMEPMFLWNSHKIWKLHQAGIGIMKYTRVKKVQSAKVQSPSLWMAMVPFVPKRSIAPHTPPGTEHVYYEPSNPPMKKQGTKAKSPSSSIHELDPVQPSRLTPIELDTPKRRPKKQPGCFGRLLSCITPSCLKAKKKDKKLPGQVAPPPETAECPGSQ